MDAKTVGVLMLLAGDCGSSSGGGTPSAPSTPAIAVCDDVVDEGTAWAESVRISGDVLHTFVSYDGCASDTLTLCWSGEIDTSGITPATDVRVEHVQTGSCHEDRGRTVDANVYEIRLQAFHLGLDEVEIWFHGERATYPI